MKNKIKTILMLCLCCISPIFMNGQDVKTTEIWLVDISNKDNKLTFGIPQRITDNDHYDNQPCFSADGKFIYFASMPDTGQTDIMEYDTKKRYTRRITNTPESEYQPQPIPNNRNLLSVVRVNEELAQGFYSVNMDGTEIVNIAENQDSLAYYAWMNDSTVGMYTLNGEVPTLEMFEILYQQSIVILDGGFGRCVQKIPGSSDLSFLMKKAKDDWRIYRYSFEEEDTLFICNSFPGEEDFCWTRNGFLLIGSQGKLYMYDTQLGEKGKWKEVADYSKTIGNFYRLAISPAGDKLAIVSYIGAKP